MKTMYTVEGIKQNITARAVDCASAQSTRNLLSLSLSLSVARPLTAVLTAYFCKQPPLSLMDDAAYFYVATQQLNPKQQI